MIDRVKEFWDAGYLFDPANYVTGAAGLSLGNFAAFAFMLEKMAATGCISDTLVIIIEISYLGLLLVWPVVLI